MSGSAIGAINEQRGGSVYTPMNGADREQKWKQMQEKSKIIVCFHICAFCPAFKVGQVSGWQVKITMCDKYATVLGYARLKHGNKIMFGEICI